MRRVYASLFFILAALRFLCVPVFVIDDDEAWSSAASIAMKSPWQFYRSAVDHKPPGFVWFYWFVDHIVPCASDPRVVRAAFTFLMIGTAAVVGFMAARFVRAARGRRIDSESVGWCAAALFLLLTALPAPKLLAVTADGLIACFVTLGYAVALFSGLAWAPLLSGVLLGGALLVKQTAVFFAIPILFSRWPRRWSVKEISLFLVGSLFVLIPCIAGLGISDFFYWNWTYPKTVLVAVRSHLFESNAQGFETLGLYLLAILPLAWVLGREAFARGRRGLLAGLGDFRVLWIIAGFCGFAIGKGLFLHYLLLVAPPVAILGAVVLSSDRFSWKTFSWLGAQYLAGCLILSIPSTGIFWGTDLVYFRALSRVMSASLRPGERVMVWGGSALPLAYAKVEHVTRFVLPRFAVAPYATPFTEGLFHGELKADPPALILDLHERGDNQFDNPIESEPFVADMVRDHYKVYVSESIPWAKFYFLKPPLAAAGLRAIPDDARVAALYEPFPRQKESWLQLRQIARRDGILSALRADWSLRAQTALALLGRQAPDPKIRFRAGMLATELEGGSAVAPGLRSKILDFFSSIASANDGVLPVPMLSRAWWASVAMVELQPRAPLGK